LGLQGDTAAMVVLQRSVDGAMAKLGFEAERKPFAGHLTLARLREVCTADDYLRFARLIESAVGLPALPFEVNHVELMRSQLTPNGPVYSTLARFPLHRQEHMGGLHASDV
jgi:2'-5' RNA ligase